VRFFVLGPFRPGGFRLSLWGVDALKAEAIASELDELPLPYRFDIKAFESIKQDALREHIQRKGIDWKSP